jgi:hypothetical protein
MVNDGGSCFVQPSHTKIGRWPSGKCNEDRPRKSSERNPRPSPSKSQKMWCASSMFTGLILTKSMQAVGGP